MYFIHMYVIFIIGMLLSNLVYGMHYSEFITSAMYALMCLKIKLVIIVDCYHWLSGPCIGESFEHDVTNICFTLYVIIFIYVISYGVLYYVVSSFGCWWIGPRVKRERVMALMSRKNWHEFFLRYENCYNYVWADDCHLFQPCMGPYCHCSHVLSWFLLTPNNRDWMKNCKQCK